MLEVTEHISGINKNTLAPLVEVNCVINLEKLKDFETMYGENTAQCALGIKLYSEIKKEKE